MSMEVERMIAVVEILNYEVDDLEPERRSRESDHELFSKGSRSDLVESELGEQRVGTSQDLP